MPYAMSTNAYLEGAYIRDMQLTQDFRGELSIDMTLLAIDYKVADYFMRLMRGDLPPGNTMGLHLLENEFTCVFCSSANPIINRHCSQCGAPRGFIVGGR